MLKEKPEAVVKGSVMIDSLVKLPFFIRSHQRTVHFCLTGHYGSYRTPGDARRTWSNGMMFSLQ